MAPKKKTNRRFVQERIRLNAIAKDAQKKTIESIRKISDNELIIIMLQQIPVFSNLLNRVKLFSNSAYTLATLSTEAQSLPLPSTIKASPSLIKVLDNLGLIAAIANFIELPMLFLASRILKKPSPATLTKFGEWMYSAVILGLTITALAAPITAPVIAAASVLLGFGYSVYIYYSFLTNRKKTSLEYRSNNTQINDIHAELTALKNQMKQLEEQLNAAQEEDIIQYSQLIPEKANKIDEKINLMTALMKKKMLLLQKIKTFSDARFLDHCVALAIAGVLVSGVFLSLFFPPLGFLVITTATALGAGYALSRFTYECTKLLYHKLRAKSEVTGPQNSASTSKMVSEFNITSIPQATKTSEKSISPIEKQQTPTSSYDAAIDVSHEEEYSNTLKR